MDDTDFYRRKIDQARADVKRNLAEAEAEMDAAQPDHKKLSVLFSLIEVAAHTGAHQANNLAIDRANRPPQPAPETQPTPDLPPP